jgi:hypothetical protein
MSTLPGLRFLTASLVLIASGPAWAQALSSSAEDSFKRALEGRIDAVTVLSGSAGTSTGLFKWKSNDIDLDIGKLNGLGDVGDPAPLGNSGLSWNFVLGGSLGSFTAHNKFIGTALDGNESRSSGGAISVEGGTHFYFPADFNSRATLGLIYGRTKNEFDATTSAGQQVVNAGLTDWVVDVFMLAPSIDLAWTPKVGAFTFQPSTRIIYFWSDQIHSNSELLDVGGSSWSWNNQMDVDYRTPLRLASYPIHLGAQFNRFDFGGEIRNGLKTDYFYSTEFRIVAELQGDLSFISFLGLAADYFWSNAFSGWSWGISFDLQF